MTDQELKDLVAGLAAYNAERAEYDKKRAEEEKERAERIDRQLEELDRQMKETDRKIKEVGAQLSGVGNNNGYYSETFFQDVFDRKPVFGGIKYDRAIPNFGRNDDEAKIEIDIALINGDSLALLEVKYRIHPEFVKEFAEERLKKFRETYPKYDNYKIYLGIAGFSFDETVLKEAKKYGVGIVKQTGGDSVEIEADCLKAY